eukprot:327856_1
MITVSQLIRKQKYFKVIFTVFSLLTARKLFWKLYYKYYNYPPGPLNFWIPFFGQFFTFGNNGYKLIYNNAQKYGKIMTIPMGLSNIIYINDLELSKTLLQSGLCDFRNTPIGDTISFANNKEWRIRRKLLTSTLFTLMKTSFVLTNIKYALSICLLTQNTQNINKTNEYFLWHPKTDLQYISFMNTTKAIWGKTFEINDPFVVKWIGHVSKVFQDAAPVFMIDLLMNNRTIAMVIIKNILKIKAAFADTQLNMAQNWCNNNGFKCDFNRNILQRTVDNNQRKSDDMYYIDYVIQYFEQQNDSKDDIINVKKIMHDIAEIMLVATDTTTITAYNGLLLLAKYKNIQKQIYNELIDVLNKNKLKEFDFSILNQLHMFRAFINDIIRCTSSVPSGLPRKVENDLDVIVINDKYGKKYKYKIHKCDTVYFNLAYINKIKWREMYGDNNNGITDVDFDEDYELYLNAWLDKNGQFTSNINAMTFAKGKRNCPGANMAIKLLYSLFGLLIVKYRFELQENAQWKQRYNTVADITPELPLKVYKRVSDVNI